MGTYSFKSVGKTQTQRVDETPAATSIPIGIKTPLEFGTSDGIFRMHHDLGDMVHDNLRNLLLTNWGERLTLYHMGANLRPLTSEWVSQDDFDAKAIERITVAIQRWMPYINPQEFSTVMDPASSDRRLIKITITYNVPALQINQRSLELSLRIM